MLELANDFFSGGCTLFRGFSAETFRRSADVSEPSYDGIESFYSGFIDRLRRRAIYQSRCSRPASLKRKRKDSYSYGGKRYVNTLDTEQIGVVGDTYYKC